MERAGSSHASTASATPSLLGVSASAPAPTPSLHRARSMIRNPIVRVVSAIASTGEDNAARSSAAGKRRASTSSTLTSGSSASQRTSGGGSSRRSSELTGSSGSGSTGTWTTTTTGSSSGTRRSSSGASCSVDTSLATNSDSKSDSIEDRDGGRALYALREDGEGDVDAEGSARGGEDVGEEPVPSPKAPSTSSWSGSETEWGENKWLEMAAHFDVQRRPNSTAAWEGRKQKYPELFRSDVSIYPSYSQFQVPYWAVCRRRSGRAMRRISRRLAEDIEELALLQTRALDGVRVVRCFSMGARPHPPPPHGALPVLTQPQRRRVEQLFADGPLGP